jgi:N-acetyltransferase 10
MLRSLNPALSDSDWLPLFWLDFKKRFVNLLSYQFRDFTPALAMSILDTKVPKQSAALGGGSSNMTKEDLARDFSPYDLKRLESYANNMLDYHVIMDLLPKISFHYFMGMLAGRDGSISLSAVQCAILVGVGLQRKTIDALSAELNLPAGQLLALFIRTVRKAVEQYREVKSRGIISEAEQKVADKTTDENDIQSGRRNISDEQAWDPTEQTLEAEMEEAADETVKRMRDKQRELIESLDLTQYAIQTTGDDDQWTSAMQKAKNKGSAVISLKNPDSTKSQKKRKHGSITAEELAQQQQQLKSDKKSSTKVAKKSNRPRN